MGQEQTWDGEKEEKKRRKKEKRRTNLGQGSGNQNEPGTVRGSRFAGARETRG